MQPSFDFIETIIYLTAKKADIVHPDCRTDSFYRHCTHLLPCGVFSCDRTINRLADVWNPVFLPR